MHTSTNYLLTCLKYTPSLASLNKTFVCVCVRACVVVYVYGGWYENVHWTVLRGVPVCAYVWCSCLCVCGLCCLCVCVSVLRAVLRKCVGDSWRDGEPGFLHQSGQYHLGAPLHVNPTQHFLTLTLVPAATHMSSPSAEPLQRPTTSHTNTFFCDPALIWMYLLDATHVALVIWMLVCYQSISWDEICVCVSEFILRVCLISPCLANLVCCLHCAATKENEEGSWAQVRLISLNQSVSGLFMHLQARAL